MASSRASDLRKAKRLLEAALSGHLHLLKGGIHCYSLKQEIQAWIQLDWDAIPIQELPPMVAIQQTDQIEGQIMMMGDVNI